MVKFRLRRAAALAIAGIACVAAAGCGSSHDSSTAAASSASSGSGGGDPAGLAAARADVATERSQPSDIGVSEPLKQRPAGKHVALFVCGLPICAQAVPFIEQPLKILGINVKVVNAGATPSSISSAMSTIVQSKPDGVIDFAVPPILWKSQLAQLAKAKIPVVLAAADPPPGMEQAVAAHFAGSADRTRFGQHEANLVAADSGGNGKSLYVWTPELADFKVQTQAYEDTLKKNCPGCSVQVLTTKSSDIGKGLPTQIVSALQRDPGIKYVAVMSGDMVIGVPEAIKAAGLSGIKIISTAGGPPNQVYIAKGEQFADLSAFLTVYLWQVVDTTARAITGQQVPPTPPVPTQWIMKANSNYKNFPPFGSDFQAEFKKLWGGG
jgi:ribose transport system substrate-binding protein